MTKFLSQPLTPALKAQITANLARLPAHMRFRGKTTPQCDFCAGDGPEHIYAASRLTSGQVQDCWRWLACQGCHDAITANNYDELYRRAASVFQDQEKANGIVRAVLLAFHADAITEGT